jgi:membrane protease YdiL (CAAX protease family)
MIDRNPHQASDTAQAKPFSWPIAQPIGFTVVITVIFIIASGLGYAIGMTILGSAGGFVGLAVVRLLIATCAAIGLFVLVPEYRHLLHLPEVRTGWLHAAVPLLLMALIVPLVTENSYRPYLVPLTTWLGEALSNVPIGVAEEFVFRGLVFAVLLQAYANRPNALPKAIGISAIAFSLIHLVNLLVGEGLAITVGQTVAGLLLGIFTCAVVIKTGSLWPPILAHTGFITIFGRVLTGANLGAAEAILFILIYVPLTLYGVAILRGSRWTSAMQVRS